MLLDSGVVYSTRNIKLSSNKEIKISREVDSRSRNQYIEERFHLDFIYSRKYTDTYVYLISSKYRMHIRLFSPAVI